MALKVNFNDDFFKFIFFDQYLTDIGSSKYQVIKTFAGYFKQIEKKDNWFTRYFLSNTYEKIEQDSIDYDTIKQITTTNPFLLLGGWSGIPGHAINIFIEKKAENNYTLYIINSGAGVENHGIITQTHDSVAVIIKYDKVSNEQLKNIFLLNKFFYNIDRTRIVHDFNERNDRYKLQNRELIKWDIETNGYCNIDIYSKKIDESDKYYEHIFEILGGNKDIYKLDKPQISGTCTFFSSYYFIKYFIFSSKVKEFDEFIKKIRIDLITQLDKTLDNFNTLSEKDRLNILNASNMIIKDFKDIDTNLINSIIAKTLPLYNSTDNSFIGEYIPKDKIKIKDEKNIDDIIKKFINEYNIIYNNLSNNKLNMKDLDMLENMINFRYGHNIFNILIIRLIYHIYERKDKLKKIPFCIINPLPIYNRIDKILYLDILLTILDIPEEYRIYNNHPMDNIVDNDFKRYLELKLVSECTEIPEILQINELSRKIIEYRGLFKEPNFLNLLPFSIKSKSSKSQYDAPDDYTILNSGTNTEKEGLFSDLIYYYPKSLTYNINIDTYMDLRKTKNIYYPIIGFNNFDYIINAINSNNFFEINKIYEKIYKRYEEIWNEIKIRNDVFPQEISINVTEFLRNARRYVEKNFNNKDELINYIKKLEESKYTYLLDGIIKYLINKEYYLKTDIANLNKKSAYYKYIENNLYDTFYKNSINKINIINLLKSHNNLNTEIYEDLLILVYIKRNNEITPGIKKEMTQTLKSVSIFKLFLEENYYDIILKYGDYHPLPGKIIFLICNFKFNDEKHFINKILSDFLIVHNNKQNSININNEQLKIDGYTNISIIDNEVLVSELYPNQVYQKNDTKEFYYSYNDELIKIKLLNNGNIVNQKKLFLLNIDDEFEYINKYIEKKYHFIINKINNVCKKYHIWHSIDKTEILIELDLYNIQIKIQTTKSKVTLIINGIEYDIIINYSFLNGLYLLNMNNGFYIRKNDKKYLFLLMPSDYILNKFDEVRESNNLYFIRNSIKIPNEILEKIYSIKFQNYHLIELSYNELIINDNSGINIYALYLSLLLSKNNIGLNLIYKIYKNIEINKLTSNDYITIIKYLPDDSPYRFIYSSKTHTERDKFLNYKFLDYVGGKLIYNSYKFADSYDISSLLELEKYKKIKTLSEFISGIKNKKLDKENIDKYLSDYIIKFGCSMLEQHVNIWKSSNYLYEYLKTFRNNCSNLIDKTEIEKIRSNPKSYPTINESFLSFGKDILSNIINIDKNLTTSIIDIYRIHYLKLYEYLINLKFLNIYEQIEKILDKGKANLCDILEIIEPLDPFIIYEPNKRNFEEICFELTTGLFLRKEQVNKINEIKQDLISDTNDKAYEILMGKGKTSTITPMVILYNYIQNHDLLNFNIILPSHLVNQSYNIMLKYSQILINYAVNTNCDYNSLINTYQINVLSDSLIKEIVLKNIIGTESLINISKNKLFIFDEIDSLIDPLKSDLNIPENKNFDHPLKEKLSELGIILIKILLKQKTPVNSPTDRIKIKNNKDEIIYTFNINFDESGKLSQMIEKKINKTIKIIQSLTFLKDYGFGDYNFKKDNQDDKKNFFTSIPYNAINSPLNESEFTDYELFLFLTIKSYFENGLRVEDIELLFLTASNDYTYNIDIFKLKYKSIFEIINESLFKEVIELIGSYEFKNKCKQISVEIKTNLQKNILLEYYLNYIIFPKYFKIYKNQSNISTIDLFSNLLSSKKISFSGTVNFEKPVDVINDIFVNKNINNDNLITDIKLGCINNIIEDNSSKGSILSSILGITTKKPDNFYYIKKDDDKMEEELLQFIDRNIQKYQCIIDSGGLLLKISVNEMVEKIKRLLPKLDYILYVTNEDIRMCFDIKNSKHSIYNNEIYNNVFIYYDQKHCIGIDFKQPNSLHGIVTINSEDTLTKISQGIFRLRKINIGQTIDFYLPEKLKKDDSNPTFIYDYLNNNEIMYKNNTLKYMQLQCIKFILRNIINVKESYIDQLYYDLVKYTSANLYIDYNEFIKILIEKYNGKLKGNNIEFKIITFDDTLVKVEQQLVQNIAKEENQNIELKQNINQNLIQYSILDANIGEYNNIEPYQVFDSYLFSYNSIPHTELLNIHGIQINLSSTYIEIFIINKYLTPSMINRIYLMYDKSNNKFFIIYEVDYYHILDKIKSNTPNYYKSSELIIWDIYGMVVLDQKPNKKVPINLLEILNNLFFKNKISIIDLYETLFKLRNDKNISLKLDLYHKIFGINLYYNITKLEFDYLIYFKIEDWCKIFDIEYNEKNNMILSKLINSYIYKYKPHNLLLFNNQIIYTYDLDEKEFDYLYLIIQDIPINNQIYTNEIKIKVLEKISAYGNDYIELINIIKKNIGFEIDFKINQKVNILKKKLDESIDLISSITDTLFTFYYDKNDLKLELQQSEKLKDEYNYIINSSWIELHRKEEAKKGLLIVEKKIIELQKKIDEKLNINQNDVKQKLSKISDEIKSNKNEKLKLLHDYIKSVLDKIDSKSGGSLIKNDKINENKFKNKYLKYKMKYLQLKKQFE
jgi:hypothetical protein